MPDALSKKEQDYARQALQANLPSERVFNVIVLSRLHKKDPLEIQSMFMDAYIGYQQVYRNFGMEIKEKAQEIVAAEEQN